MSLFVTTSRNDDDLYRALGASAIRCPIPCGDVCFWTCDGKKVAVERKKPGDLCQCINDGRYLYQAQSAKDDGLDFLVLVLEGRIHCNSDDGLLEVPTWGVNPNTGHRAEVYQPVRPVMMYSRFVKFLYEVQFLAGIQVMRTENVRETASLTHALYTFHQKPPDGHASLHQIFSPPQTGVQLIRPGLVRRVAKELPNVGWERSRAVAEHFKSVRELANADVEDWLEINGIGKKTAEKVVKEINGGGQ